MTRLSISQYAVFLFACTFSVLALSSGALAQAAAGDVWTGNMQHEGLFTPHANNCASSTEEWINFSQGTSSTVGFCMEKTTRTAQSWSEARQTCMGLGKRLPEVGEWQYACNHNTSLSGMGTAYEWASNLATLIWTYGTTTATGPIAPIMGSSGCSQGSAGRVGVGDGTVDTYIYRCVH